MEGIFRSNTRSYDEQYIEVKEGDKIPIPKSMFMKCFNGDFISIDMKERSYKCIQSSIKNKPIPGILLLERNKMYGRYKDKYLYRFIPHDVKLPFFLVPYKQKYGFCKKNVNLYMIISLKDWTDDYPRGQIVETIGDVNDNENVYRYILWCKELDFYFQNNTLGKILFKRYRAKTHEEWIECIQQEYTIEDRTKEATISQGYVYHVFSIDPPDCKDIDDAISILKVTKDLLKISIYIADVPLWLDTLQLWDYLSSRPATIYLPTYKMPMLPTLFSENICSLLEKEKRFAFVMDIFLDANNFTISGIEYKHVLMEVEDNYTYDDVGHKNDYDQLFKIAQLWNKERTYCESIEDAHDLVAFYMIFMNHEMAKWCKNNEIGIFRSTIENEHLYYDNYYSGMYTVNREDTAHKTLKLDSYIHITSPLRRIVDLLNMMMIQSVFNILSEDGKEVRNNMYRKWTSMKQMEILNIQMKQICRVQNDVSLIDKVTKHPDILLKEYDCICVERMTRDYNYVFFLPELYIYKQVSTMKQIELHKHYNMRLYIFHDVANVRRKIMGEII